MLIIIIRKQGESIVETIFLILLTIGMLSLFVFLSYAKAHSTRLSYILISSLTLVVVGLDLFIRHSRGWNADLTATLMATIFICLLVYLVLIIISIENKKLSAVLSPYLLLLAIIRLISGDSRQEIGDIFIKSSWLVIHILASVLAYGVITLSAVASVSADIQASSLRRKRLNWFASLLPSVIYSEGLVLRLLVVGEIILGFALITGFSHSYFLSGTIIVFDHKTILVVIAFILVAGLLILNRTRGTRGKAATRMVLSSYLLITLGYPGVKVVTEYLLQN